MADTGKKPTTTPKQTTPKQTTPKQTTPKQTAPEQTTPKQPANPAIITTPAIVPAATPTGAGTAAAASTTPVVPAAAPTASQVAPAAPAAPAAASDPALDEGRTVIDDGVVSKVAGIAAREVSGVHALGGGAARAIGALRSRIGSESASQGVHVEVDEGRVSIEIVIVAEYPVPLRDLVDAVRSAVRGAVEKIVGLVVTGVDVTVQDVFIPSDDAA